MENIVGLKEFRQNIEFYAQGVKRGRNFIVVKRSRPLFKIAPLGAEENWEEIVDFTKIKRGGVNIKEILSRL
jgi:antitoxin (DNA-binding transcriptional repressor) of toxin-antitoxin stability system